MRTQNAASRFLLGFFVSLVGIVFYLAPVKGDDVAGEGAGMNGTFMAVDKDGERRFESFHSVGASVLTSKGIKPQGDSEQLRSFECKAERLNGDERDAFLIAHNDARIQVGVEPLIWSDELASYSLEWQYENRQTYLDAVIGTDITGRRNLPPAIHRPADGKFARKYGENWSHSFKSPPTTGTISSKHVTAWLSEKEAFDSMNNHRPYVVGDEESKTDPLGKAIIVGHYTQIIWKDTRNVGASKWVCRTKDGSQRKNESQFEVIFANYDPPGNYKGQSPINPSPNLK